MGPGMRGMALWKKIVFGLTALFVLTIGAALAWWSANGSDFVWSKIRSDHAALLDGEEIPDELSAGAWAEDLGFLARELPRRFVRFDEAADRAAFEGALGAEIPVLEAKLSSLSRQRTILELMGVASLPWTGTGHTGIPPFQRPLDWGFYPFAAWWFDDGVWITLAGRGAEEARGAELIAVGGRPVEEILEELAPFVSADNEVGRKARLAAGLAVPEMLQGLGIVAEDGVAELTLRREGGERFALRVEPLRLASLGGLRWGRTLQSPVEAVSPADPRPRAQAHRLEIRPVESGSVQSRGGASGERLVYLQLNEVRNTEEQTFSQLAERLLEIAQDHEVAKLVIDLRANGGGNNQLVEPLVAAISGHPELDRRGVLYTLVGRRTYSAAGNLAAALELRTRTLFAGEPTGATPNHYGDAVDLLLPRSKIVLQISTRYWEDGGPYDRRPWIAPSAPELAVPFTHEDHFAGRDPVLEAVLAHRPEPLPGAGSTAPLDSGLVDGITGRYRFDPFRALEVEALPGRSAGPAPGQAPAGTLRMEIRGARTFARSELYALPGDGTPRVRFATDLPGVILEADPADGTLALDWRGMAVPLPRLPAEARLPIDLVRDGGSEALAEGIAAFRRLAAAGRVPDSQTEFELNRVGYDLLEQDRVGEAIDIFRLQTELYPEVANSFDSLGDAYRRAGDLDRATTAYRRSLELDPRFRHSRRMLEEIRRAAGRSTGSS